MKSYNEFYALRYCKILKINLLRNAVAAQGLLGRIDKT